MFTPALIKWIVGFAAVVGLFLFGYYKGYSGEHEKFVKFQADAEAKYNQQVKETERIVVSQKEVTRKADEQHGKDIATLRAIYSRLREQSGSGTLPTVPKAPADAYGATAYYVSVAPELAGRCAETTQQVINLQDWIKSQSEIK